MARRNRPQNLSFFVYTHWPAYLFGYGGISFFSFLLILWDKPIIGLFLLLTVLSLLALNLNLLNRLDQPDTIHPEDVLFELGKFQINDSFIHIDLGNNHTAVRLARKLSTGHLTVVDIYTPQLTPSSTLVRARSIRRKPTNEPRLSWRIGSVTLLPLPDQSAAAITIDRTCSQFWQHGDRDILLQEIHRVLKPGGKLLFVERIYSHKQILLRGPAAFRLPNSDYWANLLEKNRFIISKEFILNDLHYCVRADKPDPKVGKQLKWEF